MGLQIQCSMGLQIQCSMEVFISSVLWRSSSSVFYGSSDSVVYLVTAEAQAVHYIPAPYTMHSFPPRPKGELCI